MTISAVNLPADAQAGVLAGLRVADFSSYIAGPFCGMLLGDLGATVVKVERPGPGDQGRTWGSWRDVDRSPLLVAANRNKLSLTLDLTQEVDLATAHELCREADVIIESFVPTAAAALGLDHKSTLARHPQAIHCSVTAYGNGNSRSSLGGYDGIIQAYTGIMGMNGVEGQPPTRMPISAIDYFAGSLAFGSVMAALEARRKWGIGQVVDVSLFDAAVNFLSPFLPEASLPGYTMRRAGGDNPQAYPFSIFETSDGYVSLGVGNDAAWTRFCGALDLMDLASQFPDMASRLANRGKLDPIIKSALQALSSAEIAKRLDEARVPCTEIRSPGDLVADDFSAERGAIEWIPVETGGSVATAASPLRLSKSPGRLYRQPPHHGADSQTYRAVWDASRSAP